MIARTSPDDQASVPANQISRNYPEHRSPRSPGLAISAGGPFSRATHGQSNLVDIPCCSQISELNRLDWRLGWRAETIINFSNSCCGRDCDCDCDSKRSFNTYSSSYLTYSLYLRCTQGRQVSTLTHSHEPTGSADIAKFTAGQAYTLMNHGKQPPSRALGSPPNIPVFGDIEPSLGVPFRLLLLFQPRVRRNPTLLESWEVWYFSGSASARIYPARSSLSAIDVAGCSAAATSDEGRCGWGLPLPTGGDHTGAQLFDVASDTWSLLFCHCTFALTAYHRLATFLPTV